MGVVAISQFTVWVVSVMAVHYISLVGVFPTLSLTFDNLKMGFLSVFSFFQNFNFQLAQP